MKKRSLVIGLVTISLLLGITGCYGKFRGGDFKDKMFSKFDDDKDGFVDKTEYFAVSTSRFERSDDNKDSKVSKAESQNSFIAKRFPLKVDQWFKQSDLDKDGYISYDEMRVKSKEEFFAQDNNVDGKLSKIEMNTYKKEQRFKAVDIDGDNSIYKEEFFNIKSPFSKNK